MTTGLWCQKHLETLLIIDYSLNQIILMKICKYVNTYGSFYFTSFLKGQVQIFTFHAPWNKRAFISKMGRPQGFSGTSQGNKVTKR